MNISNKKERKREDPGNTHEIPGMMGVSSPKNNEQESSMELVSLSEQRRLYPDYGAWLAACRDNPGASSSYPCPVSEAFTLIMFEFHYTAIKSS